VVKKVTKYSKGSYWQNSRDKSIKDGKNSGFSYIIALSNPYKLMIIS